MSSRIEPIPDYDKRPRPCMDRQHNPPSMIVIPHGHRLVHECPSCGKRSVIYPTEVIC